MEQIVGEIYDETDEPAAADFVLLPDGSVRMKGGVLLEAAVVPVHAGIAAAPRCRRHRRRPFLTPSPGPGGQPAVSRLLDAAGSRSPTPASGSQYGLSFNEDAHDLLLLEVTQSPRAPLL